jgi:hypothetical protein
MCLWGVAGDDAVGLAARTRKVVGTLEQLLGGRELYHHHSKLMMKEARTGGAHLWHQDYGYWWDYTVLHCSALHCTALHCQVPDGVPGP